MAKTAVKAKSSAKASIEAYGDQRFFVIDGQICSRLDDLSAALKNMAQDTYSYHVNGDKNDFSQWVSDVMLNKSLAGKLAKAKDKNDMAALIEKNNK